MAEARRQEKVNLMLRDECARIIEREIELPQGVMATITRVVSSNDLYYADIFVSIFPKKEKETFLRIERATPYIQSLLNKELKMRPVPRIHFKIDEEEKARERMERLLKSIDGGKDTPE